MPRQDEKSYWNKKTKNCYTAFSNFKLFQSRVDLAVFLPLATLADAFNYFGLKNKGDGVICPNNRNILIFLTFAL